MKTRILSALVAVIPLIAVLTAYNSIIFNVAVLLIYFIALSEIHNAFREKNTIAVSLLLAAAGVYFIIQPYFRPVHDMILAAVVMICSGLIVVLGFNSLDFKTVSANAAFGAYVLIGFYSPVHLKKLLPYSEFGYDALFLFVMCMVIAWGSDIFAYFAGFFFGKHKLAPTLSPKKTVEGLIGGLAGSVFMALGWLYIYRSLKPVLEGTEKVYTITPYLALAVAVLAVIGGAVSVVGDLFASAVKRQTGIKDYGNLMPGHGGVLDRFDSVLIIAPAICCLAYIVADIGGIFYV